MKLRNPIFKSVPALVGAILLAAAPALAHPHTPENPPCQLGNGIQHVIYVQFDNTHFLRDNPNVPSDLEQMPHLLNFLRQNGTFDVNDHTVLISHTANGLVTSVTGVYSDRNGAAVSNSFGVFAGTPAGSSISFPATFNYWTDKVNQVSSASNDTTPVMVTLDPNGNVKNMPGPWVPFTRAGCDVGAFAFANLEFESATEKISGKTVLTDVANIFGSPQDTESFNQQTADFQGVAVHCAQNSPICTTANGAKPDMLPDEPGGYTGFNALFGAKYVAPAVGLPGGLQDLSGNVLTNADSGLVGFTGFDPLATQSLGAIAEMQEAGIPITFAYIADAHDDHVNGVPFGPGQAGYVAQLQAYDAAFAQFFARLKNDGIDQSNTLFVFTVEEGDHFVGSAPTNPSCDGVTTTCVYPNDPTTGEELIGEIDADLNDLVAPVDSTAFSEHEDSAPTIYIIGDPTSADFDPASPDSLARGLEVAMAGLTAPDPYTGENVSTLAAMADPVEEKLLHMVTPDPLRTPNFTYFGNPDFFFDFSTQPADFCADVPIDSGLICIDNGFAWNHGDIQPEIATTWLGMVGPGVNQLGQTSAFFSDHTDVRPTMLTLLGLQDDYTHDGRVIVEAINKSALPSSLKAHNATLLSLGAAYKQINAPFGQLGMDSLKVSTFALSSSDPTTYLTLEQQIQEWTMERDSIAGQMKAMLEGAAFGGQAIDETQAKSLITEADSLVSQASSVAASL
ncbi:MAG: hypothetical protein WBQ86_06685 [Candidatus Binatus sp.]